MKAIQLLVNSKLPEDLRDYERSMDKKSISALLADVARKYPERYEEIAKNISDVGRNASYLQGETLTLNDMRPVFDRQKLFDRMDQDVDAARKALDPEDFKKARAQIWSDYADEITNTTQRESLAQKSNLANTVISGARGNASQLRMMISTPALYTDSKEEVVPLFVRRSFGDGVRPAEYLASTYGARKSVLSTKRATAKGGDLCLEKSTLVRMADGSVKPICEIEVGDMVLGADRAGICTPTRVSAVFDQGLKETTVMEIPAFPGAKKQFTNIVCTKNHKFLVQSTRNRKGRHVSAYADGWDRRTYLLQAAKTNFTATYNDTGAALLLGLMLGDGSMPRCTIGDKSRVAFTCADVKLIQDITPTLATMGLSATQRKDNPIQYRFSRKNGKGPQENKLKQIIFEKGLAGRRCYDKHLPADIFTWSDAAFLSLLAGYTAADGCITYKTDGHSSKKIPYISYTSTSAKLLQDIQLQLQLRFGINGASIHEVTPDKKTGFTSVISSYFLCINKQDAVMHLLHKLPHIPGVKGDLQAALLHTYTGDPTTKADPQIPVGRVNFKDAGLNHCFDIEVEHPDHLFVLANGFITSNSKQMVQTSTPVIITTSDCGVRNGLDLDIEDSSIRGRVLAEDYGPIKAGTVLDRQAINELKNKQGLKKIIVRSALTCDAEEGVCAHCIGVNPKGQFPELGDTIGITAAQAMGEPIAQGALNVKHCLSLADTKVLTTKGIKLISDIKPGDTVFGFGANCRTIITVTDVIQQGKQKVMEYNFAFPRHKASSITIKCTEDHKVLTSEGIQKISNAKDLLVPRQTEYAGTINEPLAFFAGFYLGDGIRWNPGPDGATLRISCAEPDTAEELNQYLEQFQLKITKLKRSHDWSVASTACETNQDTETGRMLVGVRNPAKKLVERLGWKGSYAHEKTIPVEVWAWDKESIGAFLSGFVTADGSVYKNSTGLLSVSFSSCSYSMMEDMRRLVMLRLGVIPTCLTKIGKAGTGNRIHDQWQFTVSSTNEVSILMQYLYPFGPKKTKCDQARKNLENHSIDLKPVRARLVASSYIGELDCMDITVDAENELFSLADGSVVKNSGGAAQSAKRVFSGFDVINRFVQAPEDFPDRAVVAKQDGMVSRVEEAPQGGNFVYVGQDKHYIPAGYPVIVKNGDKLEAGDQLSEGLVDAGDIVELRGIGEGRRYYADRLKQILDDSGMPADRRNTEILARAALNHIQMEDADDDAPFLPDDVISYQQMSRHYTPPEDTKRESTSKAVGKYLQQPVLHYTIGTRITPNVIKRMEEAGKKEVYTSASAPNFSPSMVRLRTASHANRDWMAGMHTSYLKKNLAESAIRGDDTNIRENIHFAPRLAIGEGFAKNIEETGKF